MISQDRMIDVYQDVAWGRRRLRDWNRMPAAMRYLFFVVDARHAKAAQPVVALACLVGLLVTAVGVGLTSMGADVGLSRSNLVWSVAGFAVLFVLTPVLRAATTLWYERWRSFDFNRA